MEMSANTLKCKLAGASMHKSSCFHICSRAEVKLHSPNSTKCERFVHVYTLVYIGASTAILPHHIIWHQSGPISRWDVELEEQVVEGPNISNTTLIRVSSNSQRRSPYPLVAQQLQSLNHVKQTWGKKVSRNYKSHRMKWIHSTIIHYITTTRHRSSISSRAMNLKIWAVSSAYSWKTGTKSGSTRVIPEKTT